MVLVFNYLKLSWPVYKINGSIFGTGISNKGRPISKGHFSLFTGQMYTIKSKAFILIYNSGEKKHKVFLISQFFSYCSRKTFLKNNKKTKRKLIRTFR